MSEEIMVWETFERDDIELIIQGNIRAVEDKMGQLIDLFITSGYYLRRQYDEGMYKEAGFDRFEDYVKEKYGKSRAWATRMMQINKKYSLNGNDPRVDPQYRGYAVSQLQEMLYLSDEQLQEVTPDMTVKQLRALKNPVPAEEMEEQVPGQMEIGDFPEVLPDAMSGTKTAETTLPAAEVLPEPEGKSAVPAKCITGKSQSGLCGSAAYCNEPADCCSGCDKDCNIRCGWLDDYDNCEVMSGKEVQQSCMEEPCPEGVFATSQGEDDIDDSVIDVNTVAEMQHKEDECCENETTSTIYTPRYFLDEQEKILEEYISVDKNEKMPEKLMQRQKMIVTALTAMVNELESSAKEAEQPELPKLKNDGQRKAFIDAYEKWPLWIDTEKTGERYYRYELPDGFAMVVKVYHSMIFDYNMAGVPWEKRYHEGWGHEEYYLLKPEKYFHSCKRNRSDLVNFLKEMQKK